MESLCGISLKRFNFSKLKNVSQVGSTYLLGSTMTKNNAGHPAWVDDPSFNAKFRNNNGILLSSGRRLKREMQELHLGTWCRYVWIEFIMLGKDWMV